MARVSIGVRASYSPEGTWQAEGFLDEINVALEQRGLPPYQDAHDPESKNAGLGRWPALGRTLLAYGLAARIPVALLMFVAMLGNWGTHYDARPSHPPQMSTLGWWVALGLVPQLSFWIWYTIGFGALFGIVAAAIARRRGTAAG